MKRNNLSKAVYDFAKVAFAGLVIALLATHAEVADVVRGVATVAIFVVIAWLLEK